jgi:hypothetical protein
MFYCERLQWLNLKARASSGLQPEQATMRTKPCSVLQSVPGQNPKPLFTVHAYSLEQARAIAAAKVAGETIVVAVTCAGASR